ncbi:zinc finger protein RFP-like [Eucyclogobius newberryi]|uniref:zinc finger protein RFP-like n=1 Tax=Eucyclogobius newberryi TaxID=166745 RepID=UPI003B58D90D
MSTQGTVSVSSGWFEEQFKCCICLDIYSDPVTTPCGHNFCLDCIEGYWETKARSECPLCKETFSSRPALRINHGFVQIIQHFQSSLSGESDADPSGSKDPPDEVLCDVCPGPRLAAVQSCLVCQASYCDAHLGPHRGDEALQRHRLTDPATFHTSHLCRKHSQPLEMFCRTEQTPVCASCSRGEHRQHQAVPIDRASKIAKTSLKETKAEIKKMIKARMRKTEEIQQNVDASKKLTGQEMQESVQVCAMLISAVEQQQAAVVEELQRRQDEVEEKANELLSQLQMEIKELQTRGSEILNLETTQNHLHLLQSFPSLSKLPPTRDWSGVRVHPDHCSGALREAAEKLTQICRKLSEKLMEEEVDRLKQYALNVTYDPETASGWLEISGDGKKVNLCSQKKKLPLTDGAKRFDSCVCVLGKESVDSGRHYWVVEVGDKTDWDVGVARESVERKGSIAVRPDNGFWSICRRRGCLSACTGPSLALTQGPAPQKVGVFVDYERGLVSFYDAALKRHVYSFTGCEFSAAVCPYFNPCVQDNGRAPPLVICDVAERGGETGRVDSVLGQFT